VNPHRMAALGYSMGSFVLGLACAVETRLRACVLAGGGNLDGEGGYWDSSTKTMCQAIPYQAMKFLGDRGAQLYALGAAHGATLVINGTADDIVKLAQAPWFDDLRKRTAALGAPRENLFENVWIEGGGHRPYFVTRPAALWLERRLQFPNWTEGSIAAMPETHISEWARRTGAGMDALYSNELREGGTLALGEGIPAVPREKLHALPEDRWRRDKALYVYETWVERARAAVK